MDIIKETKSFNGKYRRISHFSSSTNTDMTVGVFIPKLAEKQPVPCLIWLSGLTCNDENFMQKAGAHRLAAELGIAIICPDTSPRGLNLPGEDEDYSFGSGAGFYVDSTQEPWQKNYKMFSYINQELYGMLGDFVPFDSRVCIAGHSMGGHGALISALRYPEKYHSASAFAPICHPSMCPWGQRAFTGYLGQEQQLWQDWDACELISRKGCEVDVLIDQGTNDEFLDEQLGLPEMERLAQTNKRITIRRQAGYDHSYFFVASFIADHLVFHKEKLDS